MENDYRIIIRSMSNGFCVDIESWNHELQRWDCNKKGWVGQSRETLVDYILEYTRLFMPPPLDHCPDWTGKPET